MDTDHLRKQLAALHAELADARTADPRLRGLLAKVMEDIARLLERPSAPAPTLPLASSVPQESAADRLESVAVQFEDGHPALAASVRRIIDLLGKAGL